MKQSLAISVCVLLSLAGSIAAGQDRDLTVTVHTLLGPGAPFSDGISRDAANNLYACDAIGPGNPSNPQGAIVSRIAPDLTVSTYATGFAIPMANVFDDAGNLYVTNYAGVVNTVTPGGAVTVFATIPGCAGIARDSAGNLYVSRPSYIPSSNEIRRITPQGAISLYYSGDPLRGCIGLAVDELDNLYVANFDDGRIHRIAPSNPSVATLLATIPFPEWGCIGFMAYDEGKLYCPGYHSCRVYMVEVGSGTVTVLAGTGVAGRVDGPGETAQFNQPNGVAVSASGDTLFITDDVDKTLRIVVMEQQPGAVGDPERTARSAPRLSNHPNPFRRSTTITYELPRPGTILLRIYDVRGRLIRSLATGRRAVGRHTMRWDGRDGRGRLVGAGVYLYELVGDGFEDAGKMQLAR